MLSFHYLLLLPNDVALRRKLNIKKRQYEERMAVINQRANSPLTGCLFNDYLYSLIRVILITRLLRDGWVEVHDVQLDLIKAKYLAEEQEAIFFGAVGVIIDYVIFDGVHLTGGAGWPDVKT